MKSRVSLQYLVNHCSFKSDDSLTLDKTLSLTSFIIVTRSVFKEDNKCSLQVYLHEYLCKFFERL